jgi:hypothetical protein
VTPRRHQVHQVVVVLDPLPERQEVLVRGVGAMRRVDDEPIAELTEGDELDDL